MSACWIAAHPGGKTAWDTEAQAEIAARELIKSKAAAFAVVYLVTVDGAEACGDGPVSDEHASSGYLGVLPTDRLSEPQDWRTA